MNFDFVINGFFIKIKFIFTIKVLNISMKYLIDMRLRKQAKQIKKI